MNYESMPRAELIAEIIAWEKKSEKRIQDGIKQKNAELDAEIKKLADMTTNQIYLLALECLEDDYKKRTTLYQLPFGFQKIVTDKPAWSMGYHAGKLKESIREYETEKGTK